MAQIEIILEKQLLTIQNREVISSGDMNYDACKFEFDEAWAGYIRTAVFYQDKKQVYYAVLDRDNKCCIPAMAMAKASPLYIGVFGVQGNKIITSTMDSISIVEGAVSGTELDIEPSDTVFAAMVAYYQVILDTVAEQNAILEKANGLMAEQLDIAEAKLGEAYKLLEDQNDWLRTLGAFDIKPLEFRMSDMEMTLAGYGEVINAEKDAVNQTLDRIRAQSFILRDITVELDENNEFRIDDARVDENCLCMAYFDAMSVEQALGHAVFVESHEGYIKIISTTSFNEPLTCTIEVRRGEE
ncbi:MAG: hypothetical protein NC305_13265 [Lachnospiraceae bacterium]|nr:hypothetical protein [Butyrivibrio sp.]MCM1344033.1 hypothetical protein [Muribaculaceae bacterium]MCM1411500.1 hypothetical protein [Lachnospiraceae bacterium]